MGYSSPCESIKQLGFYLSSVTKAVFATVSAVTDGTGDVLSSPFFCRVSAFIPTVPRPALPDLRRVISALTLAECKVVVTGCAVGCGFGCQEQRNRGLTKLQ
jgi:hypothetical protein